MKIDCRPYKKTLDNIRHLMANKPNPVDEVAVVASGTYVPSVVVCLYMSTYLYPTNESLKIRYKDLVKFYGYTKVIQFETA